MSVHDPSYVYFCILQLTYFQSTHNLFMIVFVQSIVEKCYCSFCHGSACLCSTGAIDNMYYPPCLNGRSIMRCWCHDQQVSRSQVYSWPWVKHLMLQPGTPRYTINHTQSQNSNSKCVYTKAISQNYKGNVYNIKFHHCSTLHAVTYCMVTLWHHYDIAYSVLPLL